MPWGKVTVNYVPTGYHQNYKRSNVITHIECQDMVADAIADSLARINIPGAIVTTQNIAQNMDRDPGENYRVI